MNDNWRAHQILSLNWLTYFSVGNVFFSHSSSEILFSAITKLWTVIADCCPNWNCFKCMCIVLLYIHVHISNCNTLRVEYSFHTFDGLQIHIFVCMEYTEYGIWYLHCIGIFSICMESIIIHGCQVTLKQCDLSHFRMFFNFWTVNAIRHWHTSHLSQRITLEVKENNTLIHLLFVIFNNIRIQYDLIWEIVETVEVCLHEAVKNWK